VARPKKDTCGVCGRHAHPDGIRHLPSKRYQARFLGPDGKSHSKTFQTTKDAQAWLNRQHADISAGEWSKRDTLTVVTFSDYAERWLAKRTVKGRPLAARTLANYHDVLGRFILGTFARRPIHTITRDEVEKWYDRTAVNSPAYRARAYSLLKSILDSATDDGYLAVNPVRIRGASQSKRHHKVRPATLEELEILTAAMPPRYRLLVQLAAWCALRFGELTELRRGDVDTKAGVLRIRRAVVLVDGRFLVKDPKSEAGVRDVNIPPHLLPMVREHLLSHTALGPDGLLFPSKNDPTQHMRQSALTSVYYPARQAAGRPDLRFHDLRHTGAVLAAQTGATLADLMGRLGHSTSQAAMRYQHTAADRDALIALRLSEMTGWASPTTSPTTG
jgi:integrase